MHKELAHGNGLRKMIVVGDEGTIYLNGAIVPRVKSLISEPTPNASFENKQASPSVAGTMRAYTTVDISDGRVTTIVERWVCVQDDETKIQEEHILFKSPV